MKSKSSTDDELFILEDSVSCASFSDFGIEGTICITKNGYIPYVAKYFNAAHLQNETFDKSQIIVADKVFIGRNVTSDKEDGPVTITNGKITIFANEVIIKNSFEVSPGAEYEIILTNN